MDTPQRKAKKENFSIYMEGAVLKVGRDVAKNEEISPNSLFSWGITIGIVLWPRLKRLRPQIELVAQEEKCSYAEAMARLIERGLRQN